LVALGNRLAQAYPDSNQNKSFRAKLLRVQLVSSVSSTLWVLMGAVGLILLIACANVANLMLARATERSREMAVRAALGASHITIVRQSLTESLVLAFTGGVFGVIFAAVATRLLLLKMTDAGSLPRLADVTLDWRVVLFAIAACFVSSIIFGLAPALQSSRVNLADALKQAGTRGITGGQPAKLRSTLVITQIALSFVLVISAGLLFRSFLSLVSAELGFRTESLLVMYAHTPAQTDADFARVVREQEELFTRIRQIPGVVQVAGAMGLPAGDYGSNGGYVVDGEGTMMQSIGKRLPQANFSLSSPGYFSTMGIPVVRGRDFTAADGQHAQPVVIISQALARQSFGNSDPIGRQIQCGLDEATMRWMTVVGVVGDVRQDSPASAAGPAMYMPLAQHGSRANEVQVAIRTQGDPDALIDPVQRLVRDMDPEIATRFTTMQAMVSHSVAAPRFRTTLALAFALLALTLAAMGVYAVMSYTTVQRTGEFAIRAALGASPRAILEHVLFGAGRLAVVGVAIGLALTVASSRVLASLLVGMMTSDAVTYAIVTAVVFVAVLLAAFLPAMRASRVDPLEALREQ
jgi:predicted permease